MIDLKLIILIAITIELLTIFGRFILKISSKEVMVKVMKFFDFKLFFHLHHGMIGILISVLSYFLGYYFFFNLGIGMLVSDAFHHFVILWSIIGNPEFHLVYKNFKYFKKEKSLEDRRIKRFIRHLVHMPK